MTHVHQQSNYGATQGASLHRMRVEDSQDEPENNVRDEHRDWGASPVMKSKETRRFELSHDRGPFLLGRHPRMHAGKQRKTTHQQERRCAAPMIVPFHHVGP